MGIDFPPFPGERRTGTRRPVDGLELMWGRARPGRWRRRGPAPAPVLNVSLTGLLVLAPKSDDLAVGARVPIEMSGGHGVVEVRYVRPSARRRWRLCGVDLIEMDDQLRGAILEAATGEAVPLDWPPAPAR
jgi:hypothetical protein